MESIKELLDQLNSTDECTTIEAKKGRAIDKSIMETICSFSNEPGLGGGVIILGVERDDNSLFPAYKVCGIENPDKLQLDIATQAASIFNQPVRPEIQIENTPDGKLILKMLVHELPDGQKPLYFRKDGLPSGAFRRIGSSDQRCTDDDLFLFYNKEDSFDSSVVNDSDIEDLSEEAIELYRNFRAKVNPYAEELDYHDEDLLQSLGCIKKVNGKWHLTYTGLLVFGKRQSLRRLLPMVRVDYIRVPGNEWIADPENRFTTIDMRGPLIELIQRIFNTITDDLPKGFLLPEGQIQAQSSGLPSRVLREALVNALIHRTYRENQPIQIIRYANRIEIKNPGFSLKPQDQLGEPGSKNRNPFIAAIFHETNLAETKGSGIRTMRILMQNCGMAPPTFESDHTLNQFTTRLLLHHFLSEEDLAWLNSFESYDLSESQKKGLIFVREVGAIDNSVYRQLNACEVLKASSDLRQLRDCDLFEQRGKSRSTYYVPGPRLIEHMKSADSSSGYIETDNILNEPANDDSNGLNEPANDDSNGLNELANDDSNGLNEPVKEDDKLNELVAREEKEKEILNEPDDDKDDDEDDDEDEDKLNELPNNLTKNLPKEVKEKIQDVGKRSNDKEAIRKAIVAICSVKPHTLSELSIILGRRDKHLLYKYVKPLREEGYLAYTISEMPNHPNQAYFTQNDKL